MKLFVWVPLLPPSANKIYVRHPGGKGRFLSPQARQFKIRTMEIIQREGVALVKFKKNVPYELYLSIFFDTVENKKSTTGDRFKRMDLSNRVKLIEDVVSDATGIDDRHNFRLVVEKQCDPNNPGILVMMREIPESEVGLTKEQHERTYHLQLQDTEPERAGATMHSKQYLRRPPWSRKKGSNRPA